MPTSCRGEDLARWLPIQQGWHMGCQATSRRPVRSSTKQSENIRIIRWTTRTFPVPILLKRKTWRRTAPSARRSTGRPMLSPAKACQIRPQMTRSCLIATTRSSGCSWGACGQAIGLFGEISLTDRIGTPAAPRFPPTAWPGSRGGSEFMLRRSYARSGGWLDTGQKPVFRFPVLA